MFANSTEVQNNFGNYLALAGKEEITITRNGKPVARLVGIEKEATFLVDSLVGAIPKAVDEDAIKRERLSL